MTIAAGICFLGVLLGYGWCWSRTKHTEPIAGLDAADITYGERKALEVHIVELKRQHNDTELKAHKRIVELLEQNSANQKALDEKEREVRELKMNHTELVIKLADAQSKYRTSELRAQDEKQRADRMLEEKEHLQLEVSRHKACATDAEHERDLHTEADAEEIEPLLHAWVPFARGKDSMTVPTVLAEFMHRRRRGVKAPPLANTTAAIGNGFAMGLAALVLQLVPRGRNILCSSGGHLLLRPYQFFIAMSASQH